MHKKPNVTTILIANEKLSTDWDEVIGIEILQSFRFKKCKSYKNCHPLILSSIVN